MKKWVTITFLSCTVLFVLSAIIVLWRLNHNKVNNEDGTVHIKKDKNGYQLYRNGVPFYIKGAGGDKYFKELSEIGANTVRIYNTLNIENKLDEAHKYKLAVIVDLPMYRFSTAYNLYASDSIRYALKADIEQTVRKYKNHPALLMWNLGNELQYPTVIKKNRIAQNFDDLAEIVKEIRYRGSFIGTFNELIDLIHKEDPNHPITTSIATNNLWKKIVSIHLFSPNLDILGYNIFAPPNRIRVYIDRLSHFVKLKPYYLSEWGTEGPWAQEKTKWSAPIEATSTRKGGLYFEDHAAFTDKYKESLGGAAFYWGQKQERTHTWFSIFDEEGRKSQVYYTLKSIWKNVTDSTEWPPQIKYMTLGGKGARDNLVFSSNEIVQAQLLFENNGDTTFQYKWEVYEEGWNYAGGGAAHIKPKRIEVDIEINNDSLVSFRTPLAEGSYRIFVNVYNSKGDFATTNTPFYVLNPDK